MTKEIIADYVLVGSGAVGMAFADIILHESDASMLIIDRYAKPGGHWNVAYPFVTLHQPSTYYGVSSKELSGGRIEQGGLNGGLGELASGAEVSAYYDDIMRHQFLPSGRVQYYPLCDYQEGGQFVSMTSGKSFRATANKKTVNCTWMNTLVPSTHTPNFKIDPDVRFGPVNDLTKVTERPNGYVIIGGGKTAIDAILWLLENHVEPEEITWIVNRDAWLLNRRNTQMSVEFFFDTFGTQAAMTEAIAQSQSPNDMFHKLEACGYFLRVDPEIEPEMFHGATVSVLELEQLRRVKNVVRKGHVTHITPSEIMCEKGNIPTTPHTFHVDCAAGLRKMDMHRPHPPVFNGDVITPQLIRPYQPVFSAAMIAHCELNYESDNDKNELCRVVPGPDTLSDFIRFTAASLANEQRWSQDSELQDWMANNRLEGAMRTVRSIPPDAVEKWAVITRIVTARPGAAKKLGEFLK